MVDPLCASIFWTLNNFDMCPHLPGQRLYSPKFNVGSYEFRLFLCPRGDSDPKYIPAFLNRVDNCSAELFVEQKLSVVDRKIDSSYFPRMRRTYKHDSIWGWDTLIERDKLYTMDKICVMPFNIFIIQCDVIIISVNETKEDKRNKSDGKDADILSRDFAEVLNSGMHSDMVLVVDESKFKVHRAIIECRCPKLLLNLMESEVVNEYSLEGIKAPVLRTLLHYLYTGVLRVANNHEEILAASYSYDIPDLKNLLRSTSKVILASTELTVSRLTFKWEIPNFCTLPLNQELVYPAFCETDEEWTKMKIILTVLETGFQLKFEKLKSNNVEFIHIKVSIFNKTNTKLMKHERSFRCKDFTIQLTPLIERQHMLPHDTMDLDFDISMSKNETQSKIKKELIKAKIEQAGGQVIKNSKSYQNNLRRLFIEGNLADITFRVEDDEFRAHKFILCARSRVFARMFENECLERKEGVITIEDIDSGTVSSMLKYIYCGCIDGMNVSKAIKLYTSADKYELLTLREKCATFLEYKIDAENIGDILLLADVHSDSHLKERVYDYMISNPKQILESKIGFSVLKNSSNVYLDVIIKLLEHISSIGQDHSQIPQSGSLI